MADSTRPDPDTVTVQAKPAVVVGEAVAPAPVPTPRPAAQDAPYVSGELRVGEGSDIRYLTEQEEARERLKASVDRLTQRASLQVQVEKEPLKMLGGASAVGAVVGLMLGSQLRRSKKIYVDAHSPVKHQKAFVKAQQKAGGKNDVGGALVATLGTLAVKMLTDKVLAPKLEQVAQGLLDKAGQPQSGRAKATPVSRAHQVAAASSAATVPAQDRAALQSAPQPAAAETQLSGVHYTANPVHPGVVPIPDSKVEAKAQGTPIAETDKHNPNL